MIIFWISALAVGGHGPARRVGGTAVRVDPDDLRAELRERHPAERRGDEGRDLNDPQAREGSVGGQGTTMQCDYGRTAPSALSAYQEVDSGMRSTSRPVSGASMM